MQYVLERNLTPAQNIKVEKSESEVSKALLYRGWKKDGEHGEKFCIELQFKNKKTAISWLKRHRILYEEIDDHQELPFNE